jgi:hypothetical protein
MNLVADWVMPYEGVQDVKHGSRAKCRVRIYEYEIEPADLEPLILITELEDNARESIVSSAEVRGEHKKVGAVGRTDRLAMPFAAQLSAGLPREFYALLNPHQSLQHVPARLNLQVRIRG